MSKRQTSKALSPCEIREAEAEVVRSCQREAFPGEYKALVTGKPIPIPIIMNRPTIQQEPTLSCPKSTRSIGSLQPEKRSESGSVSATCVNECGARPLHRSWPQIQRFVFALPSVPLTKQPLTMPDLLPLYKDEVCADRRGGCVCLLDCQPVWSIWR